MLLTTFASGGRWVHVKRAALVVQTDEVAFLPGGCGALAGAFRNYDVLSTPQRQKLLQARFPSLPPPGVPPAGVSAAGSCQP